MKRASVVSVFALGVWLSSSIAKAQQPPAADAPVTPPRGAAPPATAPTEGPSLADPNKTPMEPKRPDMAGDTSGTTGPGTSESAPTPPSPPAVPPPSSASQAGALTPLPMWPEPGRDAADLKRQGAEQKRGTAGVKSESDIYAEDWWSHARPILELHGNFRVRTELFYHFSLGRIDAPSSAIWPRSPNDAYSDVTGTSGVHGSNLCTQDETNNGTDSNSRNAIYGCRSGTQAGANMRFRLDPELHISDNLRVISQVDLFDNLVLGSTPSGYYNVPASGGGYAVGARSGYEALGFNTATTATPTAGVNGWRNSIAVKRAWAEYATPVGELRFGRMPNQWGLGMVYNAGDGHDDNFQSSVDRIQFTTGFKPLDLYVSGSWDFVNEGPTSDNIGLRLAQPYDLSQLDDVDQYVLAVYRKKSRELTRLALSHGDLVLNGGVQVEYRKQLLADDQNGGAAGCSVGAAALNCTPNDLAPTAGTAYTRRAASTWTPDLWVQALYKKFRFELEAVTVQGSIDNSLVQPSANTQYDSYKIREYGIVTELEQKLVEDKLHLGFNFGWASGDPDVGDSKTAGGLTPPTTGFDTQHGDHTISTFRFNPSYQVDLILYRNILTRVQGTYYFRPSVKYDFLRDNSGQKLGGGLAAVWSRATQFMQAPGHERDLGIELNAQVYFQSKDGALNDDPDKMGGFFTKLEYGVLFPMAGMGYPSGTASQIAGLYGRNVTDLNAAQTLRWYLGVFF